MLRTKIFASLVASWLAISSAIAADVTLVNLDGTGVFYDLSIVGRFELTNGGTAYRLIAREGGALLASGSLSSLRRISFLDEDITSVVTTDRNVFSLEKGELRSSASDSNVRVYSLSGALVRTSSCGKVSTDGLPAGAYIVVSGGKAAKIIVK